MSIDITVQVRDRRWKTLLRPYCKTVEAACGAALKGAKSRGAQALTVVLADDAFIRRLNRDFRGHDKPTNVLSFPSGEKNYLGDIILSLGTVRREAKRQGKSARDHATHLLVHGTLHLLGFDHEQEREAARMERLEIKILEKLGIGNPY